MKRLLTFLAISTALLGSVAHSQESNNKMYLEVAYAYPSIDISGAPSKSVSVGVVRFGYNFTEYFAGEVFVATGLSNASYAGILDLKVDSAYGFYLKGKWEVAPGFELFAKPGYAKSKLKASGAFTGSGSDDSFSWAAGGQYHFNDKIYGQIDYASYYDKSGVKVAGPSISIGFKF